VDDKPAADGGDAGRAVLAHDLLNDLAVISHLGAVLADQGHALDAGRRRLIEDTRNDRIRVARGRLGGLPHRLARRASWELAHLDDAPSAACTEALADVARGLDPPLRVLLLETDADLSNEVGDLLASGGHEVLRCCESHDRAPRCLAGNGLAECPLDRPVDVTVAVRSPGWRMPRPRETGVACAIHAGVPLVVAGAPSENPYSAHTSIVTDEHHVIDACRFVADDDRSGSES
jgi:hypothetical protein